MFQLLQDYKEPISQSIVTLIVLLILRSILTNFIRKAGSVNDKNISRTVLLVKYVNATVIILLIAAAILIWGVNFEKLGIFISSIFAVIGVAMFAQWSILSNITAGVILFFSFPFKIGDKIRIQDKDFPSEATIEDIKAFHILLRTDNGELLTYPNNLLLQKGIVVIGHHNISDDDSQAQ
ncbi:mechanosensitive ion channel domain-containing protein [Zhouia sp. PK063]|uniref:mechanosensitive ion channel domain-containing protein n=1 Tax=Zhouia sp. PK063 TaxID=3373602 RepID=UPI0037AAF58A